MRHLLFDISPHGLGHFAQAIPFLEAFHAHLPRCQITLQTGLSLQTLQTRLSLPFTHLPKASDFGFVMQNALKVDVAASGARYRAFHENWSERVAQEAKHQKELAADLIVTNVAYLPLAASARSGIPAFSMCSLNWADIFWHLFQKEPWAAPIYQEICDAYQTARAFFRLTPAMPMPALSRLCEVSPMARLGHKRQAALRAALAISQKTRLVLASFGGFEKNIAIEKLAEVPNVHWLVPKLWCAGRKKLPKNVSDFSETSFAFSDLLASVDAIFTKPGYGTFVEAAGSGVAVLYLRRDNWPEEAALTTWLHQNTRAYALTEDALLAGDLPEAVDHLFLQTAPRVPSLSGGEEIVAKLASLTSTKALLATQMSHFPKAPCIQRLFPDSVLANA